MFGDKLIELRKSRGLSQEKVAEHLSVTRQTISNWETNQAMPTIDKAKDLSKLFKISLDELLENDISSIMMDRMSNVEKLASMLIKIIKGFGVVLIVLLILCILSIIFSYGSFRNANHKSVQSDKGEIVDIGGGLE
ncbi:MAG: helix-turn-helix transcriptional regulator [Beduini sp.]|uniref:helix-turn-helix transcriptional regulator n=1 Tax=Beduini sp. TaxID=1922300 RepID=UPI00399F2AFF